MAAYALVGHRIADGQRVLDAVDNAGLDVIVALWLYSSEWGEWRLGLASSLVDLNGPRSFYGQVQSALRRQPVPAIRLDQMTVRGLNDPLILALRASGLRRPGVEGTQLNGWYIGGIYIEDAYVYRVR